MSRKNLLADTDFTDGRDKRFVHTILLGKVKTIECTDKQANITALMPDRLDHEGTPLTTKAIPVLQISAGGKKQFAMPRIGQNVILLKLPNSTSSYAAINAFYTSNDPPPVKDPLLDYTIWDDGKTYVKFDANKDADPFLTWDFQGGWKATVAKDINIKTTNGAKVNIEGDGTVTVKSDSGDIVINAASGQVTIQGSSQITLTAPTIKLDGFVHTTGNMLTDGVHTDSLGHHH